MDADRPQQAFEGGRHSASFTCMLLLLAADTGFVILHVIHKSSPLLLDSFYHLGNERGYGEMFQYVKIYWIVAMLAAVWSCTRQHVYAAWTLLYAYVLCDEALRIHERAGSMIAGTWNYEGALGLRPDDFGELTVFGAFGLAFLALISLTYWRASREAREASKDLVLLFAMLVFFGLLVDMLHAMAGGYIKDALGVLEDGGEMLVMSAVFWYVLTLLERRGSVPRPLWQSSFEIAAKRLRFG